MLVAFSPVADQYLNRRGSGSRISLCDYREYYTAGLRIRISDMDLDLDLSFPFYADQNQVRTYHFDADPDPTPHQSDGNLRHRSFALHASIF
jgi:hypothetical protein